MNCRRTPSNNMNNMNNMNNINNIGFNGYNNQQFRSPAQQNQYIGSNMNVAFQQNKTLIDQPDFSNKGGVIHNNLGSNLLEQKIVEYKLHINSEDRDLSSHKSPFNFKIQLRSNSNYSIGYDFTNIKYISIDSIILPRTTSIDISDISNNNIYPTGSHYSNTSVSPSNILSNLKNRKYLLLNIKELDSNTNLGTSTQLGGANFILTDSSHMGLDNICWKPLHSSTIVFSNSSKPQIHELTIKIYDENGNLLTLTDQSGIKIIGNNIQGTLNDYIQFVSNNEANDSVKYTNSVTQVLINMTIGVVENEMNTNNVR